MPFNEENRVITLFQNIFIETLKYKRHSSPSLYSRLFIPRIA